MEWFMSIELHNFMHGSRVPTRQAWQQVIEEEGFPTVLDATLDVQQQIGFSPTVYAGRPTGFEFLLEPASDLLSYYPHIADRVGDRKKCATFRWGEDLTEMAAALSAAAALTKLTDGIYYYPNDDIVYGAGEVIEATRSDLSAL
jgi:hypothetical protein